MASADHMNYLALNQNILNKGLVIGAGPREGTSETPITTAEGLKVFLNGTHVIPEHKELDKGSKIGSMIHPDAMSGMPGSSGEISYELYLRNHKLGNQLWEIVREAGLEFNITPIAPNAIRSIEGGLLSYASDILREDTPFSIGLNRLVDTNQSVEFIGKAALKKIEEEGTKRKLVGIVIEGNPIKSPPEQFWSVLDNDLKIGHVSRCIYSPRLEKNIGFANVPIEFSDTDMTFSVSTPDGDKMATVCTWPWFPAERINKKT